MERSEAPRVMGKRAERASTAPAAGGIELALPRTMITAILLSFLLQDTSKALVERPLKAALAATPLEAAPRTGLVRWHASFGAAQAAARASGKPVLLFQLLGRLDDEFC